MRAQVVLPEGAGDIRPSTPFPMQTSGDGRKFSYLDTTGRPVLILRKTNLVSDHNKDFSVTYQVRPPGFTPAGCLQAGGCLG